MEKSSHNNMVFGVHPVLELFRADQEVEKVFIQSGLRSPQISEIAGLSKQRGIPVQFVPIEKLNRLTRKNHQGVVAFICPIQYQLLEQVLPMIYEDGRMPFLLALDRVTDVRNFGAIARTAYAAGVDAIIIPSRGSALINGDAMKTSAGCLSLLPVCRTDNMKESFDYMRDCGLRLVGMTEKAQYSLWEANMGGPICVVMGSEEDGISEAYRQKLDEEILIPMPGDIDSLNVSVAAGIACFEVVRQRRLMSDI